MHFVIFPVAFDESVDADSLEFLPVSDIKGPKPVALVIFELAHVFRPSLTESSEIGEILWVLSFNLFGVVQGSVTVKPARLEKSLIEQKITFSVEFPLALGFSQRKRPLVEISIGIGQFSLPVSK